MSRPLRVAYLSRYLPSPSETFVLDEAQALAEAGARVTPMVLDRVARAVRHARHERLYAEALVTPRPSSPRAVFSALTMGEGPAEAWVRYHWAEHGRPRDLGRVAWIARMLRSLNVDIVRVHHAAEVARFAVAAGLLAGVPVSVAVHARDLFVPVRDFSWILRGAAQVTTITPFHRDRLLRAGLSPERVDLLPCPVHVPDGIAAPPEVGGPLRVLAVGRLVAKKGHDLLMRACALLAQDGVPVELTLIGDGPDGMELRALAHKLERAGGVLTIDMMGAQPVEVVERELSTGRYHAAALACRVSPDGDRDGVPVFLLEAQARGVPVVSTAVPGFEFELQVGSRLVGITPQANGAVEAPPERITEALAELFRDPGLGARLAAEGRATAERRIRPGEIGARLLDMLLRVGGSMGRP